MTGFTVTIDFAENSRQNVVSLSPLRSEKTKKNNARPSLVWSVRNDPRPAVSSSLIPPFSFSRSLRSYRALRCRPTRAPRTTGRRTKIVPALAARRVFAVRGCNNNRARRGPARDGESRKKREEGRAMRSRIEGGENEPRTAVATRPGI